MKKEKKFNEFMTCGREGGKKTLKNRGGIKIRKIKGGSIIIERTPFNLSTCGIDTGNGVIMVQ